jgi:hypothetical protein
MSIYTKPLSQLEAPDLQELLNEGAVENSRLEFKLLVPNKEDTLKKLSSFANTFGGFMVIGAKADSTDGRIQDLPGVDVEPGYKQKVVQWCFDAVSPPLVVEVSDPIATPAGNGKVCYVVYTAESEVAPHFLNGRKGIWVRTDEFSARYEAGLANENELRHLFDRRKLIRERRVYLLERAKRRFDTYSARKHTDAGGNRTKFSPHLTFCIVPRFPARQLCQQEKLKDYIQSSWMAWCQVTFPDSGTPILSQHESAIVLNITRDTSILEVNVWGMLFYAAEIDNNESGTLGIHLYQFVGYVLVFIAHAAKMLQAMGYSGPILIDTALGAILGVPWLNTLNRAFGLLKTQGSELDNELAFSIETTSEALREKPDGVAMDVLRLVLFSVNSSGLVDTPRKLEDLVRIGYEYNCWPKPTNLRI